MREMYDEQAQQKRDRAAKDGKKEPNSQLKTNEKAMNKVRRELLDLGMCRTWKADHVFALLFLPGFCWEYRSATFACPPSYKQQARR